MKIWIGLLVFSLAACSAPAPATLPVQPQVEQASALTPAPTDAPMQIPADTPSPPPTGPVRIQADLEDFGPAPELENEVWLNVDQPLRLADLRGKVILLEMWTFG